MDKVALIDLIYLLTFLAAGLVVGVAPTFLSLLLAPRRTRSVQQKTLDPIECGMPAIGSAWIRYGVVYYLYALMFVAFSVDVLFLFPVAVIYRDFCGWPELLEIVLFVGILSLVIVYAWKKGVFSWKSRLTYREG